MELEDSNELNSHGRHTFLTLYELRERNLLCDAIVRLDDGASFPVHRAILSASSSYFMSLFTTTLNLEEVKDAVIPDVTSVAMRGVLEYAYLRTIKLLPFNVCQILTTADYLCVDGAQKLCCNYIRDHIAAENCIGIMLFARTFAFHDLESHARRFILTNFVEVGAKSEELLQLSAKDLCLIIGDDLLNIRSEETVWECVVRWVNVDPKARKGCLADLLGHMRLGLLDTPYFLEQVKDNAHVVGNASCRPIIIETLRFLYDLEMIAHKDNEIVTPTIARPRVPHEILFAVGGWSGGTPTNSIESYDTRADRWIEVNGGDPTGPRAYHGTIVIDHYMYVIGGFNGRDYFNSCRCFDAVSKTWREVAPMYVRRCYVSVALLNGSIYAMGGYDGHERHSSGERFDRSANQWTIISSMNVQRSDADATVLNGKIYMTGGFNGHDFMNTVEVYDPAFNQWTFISPMRSRRSGVSCIAFHDCIYAVGGFNGISRMCSAERYNPATDLWTPVADMYNPRSNFAVEVIDDLLFAIGGFNGVTTIAHVECFDENLDEWFEAEEMKVFRSALSACVMRNLPNVSDYTYEHRERLIEEKRLKVIARERLREEAEAEEDEGGGGVMGVEEALNPQAGPNFDPDADAEHQMQPLEGWVDLPLVPNQVAGEERAARIEANGDEDENEFDFALADDEAD